MPAAPPPAPPVVCEVTAPGGVGRAILVTLRGAPCALIPFHVVGDLERLDDEVIVVAPNAAVATLRPDAFLAHSPPPEDGRPPDPNRMDYVLVACGVPEGVDRAHLRPLEDSLSRFDARGDARRVLDAERVPGDDDAHVVAAGDEVFVSTLTREDWSSAARAKRKERRVLVEWRRGFVTSPPGDREGVSLRYDARTVAGESGCAVVAHSKRRACDDPDGAVTVASARGCGRLVAMHRAGAPGRDAEAVALADVMRDVLETTAARGVRRAAERGNFGPAVAELARDASNVAARGRRCRAAAAGALAVASDPRGAAAAMAALLASGGFAPAGAERSAIAAAAIEREIARWVEAYPRSARMADAACRALGAMARKGVRPRDGGAGGDACLTATLERHYAVEAVRTRGEWALRARRSAFAPGGGGEKTQKLRFVRDDAVF